MTKFELNNFSQQEKIWLETMLSKNFSGNEIILKQLNSAQVTRKYNTGYFSIKTNTDKRLPQFPFEIRVPVEMRVFGKDKVPIVFLLHVVNGYVDELEIFNADSSPLSKDIQIENAEVIIDKILL